MPPRILFLGEGDIVCDDAADSNDDGLIDIADAIYTLTFLFALGPNPALPFPDPGDDPTEDDLECLAAVIFDSA